MRADDTIFAAWSRTTTDMRRLASPANAIAPSMMTRASASEICDGVNGGGGLGACAKLVAPSVNNSDRLAIANSRHDESRDFIVPSRRFCFLFSPRSYQMHPEATSAGAARTAQGINSK